MNFTYDKRDPISLLFALLMAIGLFLTINFHPTHQQSELSDSEFIAMLDQPAPPVVQEIKKEMVPEREVLKKENPSPVFEAKKSSLEKQSETVQTSSTQSSTLNSESSPNSALSKSADSTPMNKSANEPQALSVKYETYVLSYLEKNKRYPTSREARQSRPEGIVKIYLDLNRQGLVIGYGVLQSSGSNLLDAEAIKTVKYGSFPAFPENTFSGQDSHRFVANLKYSIVNNGYQTSSSESN